MTNIEAEEIKNSAIPALKTALLANERSHAWASRKLEISPGYMSQLMSSEDFRPSLELALKINDLVAELTRVSMAI
jgi:hypothetical protein